LSRVESLKVVEDVEEVVTVMMVILNSKMSYLKYNEGVSKS